MRYFQIFPRLNKIIGLELFVFVSFLGICAFINAVIVGFPDAAKPFWNFVLAALQVFISMILIVIWLLLWYYLTKKLIKTKPKEENNERE